MIFGLSSIQLSTFEFPIASYIWYFHKYILVVVVFFFCACKNRNTTFMHIKCTVKSKERHSSSLSGFLDEFAVFI